MLWTILMANIKLQQVPEADSGSERGVEITVNKTSEWIPDGQFGKQIS